MTDNWLIPLDTFLGTVRRTVAELADIHLPEADRKAAEVRFRHLRDDFVVSDLGALPKHDLPYDGHIYVPTVLASAELH